jgi:uncharacterized surface protein with fasciclin (FAS1) repeats
MQRPQQHEELHMTKLRYPMALAALTFLAACGDSSSSSSSEPPKNIVQLAQSNPDLSILVDAVVAADLADTLSGPGPFTVFAPTNAAFADLLTELDVTKEELLADTALLTAVLQYHVLGGEVTSDAIPFGKAITPLGGGFFKIDSGEAGVVITDGRNRTSKVVTADVMASNGVVHVIDKVILPADKNIVQTAQALPDFSILVDAVVAADLADTLSGPGPFTVFAPTNAAFADLLTELDLTAEELLGNTALLTEVLTYHVLAARVLKADVVPGVQPATVQGDTFSISAGLVITDQRDRTANITSTDVLTSNGVIHVIDRVILPAP